jgi:membrane protease YdiL (CAAX protease family)
MHVATIVLARNAIAALAVQAAIAEWAAGRLAVTWSDPLEPLPTGTALRRRLGVGAAWGLGAASTVVVLALATRRASIEPATPALGAVLFGAVPPVLMAVRDELLLRGMVLKVGRSFGGPLAAVALCGGAAAAASYGSLDATALSVVVEGLRGVALALVWTRDRGAWMAIGASAAWNWTLDSATRGDLIDVRLRAGEPGASVYALVVVCAWVAYAAWRARAGATRAPEGRER